MQTFCELDWSSITTAAGVFMALWIFTQWKSQKGSEVVASEAKEIVYKINELGIYYKNNRGKVDISNVSHLVNDFNLMSDELLHKLDFISRALDNKDDKREILKFALSIVSDGILCISKMNDPQKTTREINNLFITAGEKFRENKHPAIRVLMDYSLYKKSIKSVFWALLK